MHARLRAFVEQFALKEDAATAMETLFEELLQESMEAGQSVLVPEDPPDANAETDAAAEADTHDIEEEIETIDILEYVEPASLQLSDPETKEDETKDSSASLDALLAHGTKAIEDEPAENKDALETPKPEAQPLITKDEDENADANPDDVLASPAELPEPKAAERHDNATPSADTSAAVTDEPQQPPPEDEPPPTPKIVYDEAVRQRSREAEATTLSLKDAPAERELTAAESAETLEPELDMPPLLPEERYDIQSTLGIGGMGRVYQVRDWRLKRTLAMKVLHPNWLRHPEWIRRFIEEAQATATLQHPGIVPVHDLGQFTDGRFFFTMKQIVGRTLSEVIKEVHEASKNGRWETTETGWSFRRLLDAFHRVCEAVAYAHSFGILHRDLKPENVMLGEHGEVKVVDWGLVKLSPQHNQQPTIELDAVTEGESERQANESKGDVSSTQHGEVKGTPAYMAPEQAAGEVDRISPATDVYGLGAILYEILSGHAPYTGKDVRTVLFRILSEAPKPPGRLEPGRSYAGMHWVQRKEEPQALEGPMLPWSLVNICNKAMARPVEERFSDAGEFAHEIEQWLEGAQKRARATELLEEAQMMLPSSSALRRQADEQRRKAVEQLSQIGPWEKDDKKRKAWTSIDEATQLEWEAWMIEVEAEQKLQAALSHAHNLEEAHFALVRHYGKIHREAEQEQRSYTQMRASRYLQAHTDALSKDHPIHQTTTAYLSGEGAVSLVTDPPGAQVLLYRYVTEDRRMKPVFVRFLGETPLKEVRLGMGSYLLVLRKDGYEETRYPVFLERMEHWQGIPPEEAEAMPIKLLPHGSLAANECYVPAGWAWFGGDKAGINALPRQRLWVDPFVMQRYSNTNTQVIAFLDDLVAQGKLSEALRYVPRERAGTTEKQGAMIYGRTPEGGFVLRPDTEGDIWYPNYPALMMDWYGAQAFARWFSQKTRHPWRLPSELEWEKAARGVDGRFYPWGDFLDPSWCCMRESRPGRPLPSVVGTHKEDRSPYGVQEMAGNVRDWCLDIFRPHGPRTHNDRVQIPVVAQRPEDTIEEDAPHILRVRRGGGWELNEKLCRVSSRDGDNPTYRDYMSGFRLVRSLW